MKMQTEVITTFGKFLGDLSEDVDSGDVNQIKKLFEKCNELSYLSISKGKDVIYFPADVIRKSIIILHVIND
jgi:hypothetical protein